MEPGAAMRPEEGGPGPTTNGAAEAPSSTGASSRTITLRPWMKKSGVVVGTAVVGALTTALITEGRIDALWDSITGRDARESSSTLVEYKRAVTRDGAVSVALPESWSVLDAPHDVPYDGEVDEGSALFGGSGIVDSAWAEDTVFVAASSASADRLDLVGASPQELSRWADQQATTPDWTIDNCVLASEPPRKREGYIVASRHWDNCATTEGMRLWEYFAAPLDGTYLVSIQIVLTPDAPTSIADQILRTWAVASEKLPDEAPSLTSEFVLP